MGDKCHCHKPGYLYLAELGGLAARPLLVHAVQVTDEDIDLKCRKMSICLFISPGIHKEE
jgi:hypothetical protein